MSFVDFIFVWFQLDLLFVVRSAALGFALSCLLCYLWSALCVCFCQSWLGSGSSGWLLSLRLELLWVTRDLLPHGCLSFWRDAFGGAIASSCRLAMDCDIFSGLIQLLVWFV